MNVYIYISDCSLWQVVFRGERKKSRNFAFKRVAYQLIYNAERFFTQTTVRVITRFETMRHSSLKLERLRVERGGMGEEEVSRVSTKKK